MLSDKIRIIPRRKIEDSRGYFYKVIDGKEESLPNYTGEVYITMAKPFEAKGGHYHPLANEWFTLIKGSCTLELVDLTTNEKLNLRLDENDTKSIFVPNNVAHIFKNDSDTEDFILLAYTDQLYKPEDTIIFHFTELA